MPWEPCRAEWPALPPGSTMMIEPELKLRTMSVSKDLQQQGSTLMPKAYVVPKGHMDAEGLVLLVSNGHAATGVILI